MLLYYFFPSIELTGPNLFYLDNDPMHKATAMNTWFVRVGVVVLVWSKPKLNSLSLTPGILI